MYGLGRSNTCTRARTGRPYITDVLEFLRDEKENLRMTQENRGTEVKLVDVF